MNALNTVRNHWKKSVFAVLAAGYGVYYADRKWKDRKLMQAYCMEAKKYGDIILKSTNRPKRVTVILNPAANKGNGKSTYEKNVAPLLHLAGIEVNLIITQFEGQAKRLMAELENADAVVVAGGDGTLSEAVTGLLRRSDEVVKLFVKSSKVSNVPTCIIPLGKTNSLARALYLPSVENTVQFIAEMAMTCIDGQSKQVDVIHVKGSEDKSVFAVSNLNLGAFTDSEMRKKKNWYFGPLKDRLCYVITALRHWTTSKFTDCHVSYTLPCAGCNKCKEPPQKQQWKWWHLFVRPRQEVVKDYSNVNNEFCRRMYKEKVDISQLNLSANSKASIEASDLEKAKSLTVSTTPGDITRSEFIMKGWEMLNKGDKSDVNQTSVEVDSLTVEFMNVPEDKKFLIDSEQFELMPTLSVQILPNKLKFYFCPKNRISS